jgi:tRNA-Thr(GGU) m(6)t(6)A37 methyltransferase TsaA
MLLNLSSIGVIRSPFIEADGTPIQPLYAGGFEGTVEVFEAYAEGLADLERFDRIWLLYWCHRATGQRMRVVPYRDICERGLFATRAPARPNPIGLSCVRLLRIDGCVLGKSTFLTAARCWTSSPTYPRSTAFLRCEAAG